MTSLLSPQRTLRRLYPSPTKMQIVIST